jgi:hypothetical protein
MAYGVGNIAWRGDSIVHAPVPAGYLTCISSQRAWPLNIAAPKSSVTVNRPCTTFTPGSVIVEHICVPPASASNSANRISTDELSGTLLASSCP